MRGMCPFTLVPNPPGGLVTTGAATKRLLLRIGMGLKGREVRPQQCTPDKKALLEEAR